MSKNKRGGFAPSRFGLFSVIEIPDEFWSSLRDYALLLLRAIASEAKQSSEQSLSNLDGLHGLFLLFQGHLGDADVEDAVFDLRADLVLVDVLR